MTIPCQGCGWPQDPDRTEVVERCAACGQDPLGEACPTCGVVGRLLRAAEKVARAVGRLGAPTFECHAHGVFESSA